MTDILHDLSPERIPLALDANKIAFAAMLGSVHSAAFHQDDALTWFETGVPLDLANGVVQAHIPTNAAPDTLPHAIDELLAYFARRQLPFYWRIGPSSHPADFGPLLVERGIAHVEDEPGMALGLHALNEEIAVHSKLVVEQATTGSQLEAWMRTWGCGAPEDVIQQRLRLYRSLPLGPDTPLRLYLGLLSGKPVATAALFLAAGVAAIEDVVTLPQVRRLGIGAGVTLAVARAARAAGYSVAVLTASPMGIRIYRWLGFREYCTFSTYAWSSV
ncbi:MAG TPA: GNAT family N-acetyltransferase [Ktedonobacterales bacterium]